MLKTQEKLTKTSAILQLQLGNELRDNLLPYAIGAKCYVRPFQIPKADCDFFHLIS
jgi:hypothetical protein